MRFEFLTAVIIEVTLFQDATTWRWRQYIPPECRWTSTSLHGITSQKTVTFNLFPYFYFLCLSLIYQLFLSHLFSLSFFHSFLLSPSYSFTYLLIFFPIFTFIYLLLIYLLICFDFLFLSFIRSFLPFMFSFHHCSLRKVYFTNVEYNYIRPTFTVNLHTNHFH
jgi:hypothetical protein